MKILNKQTHKYIELILYRTITGLRSEATKNLLSFSWWIIEPVLYMLVFYLVFGFIFKRGSGEHFIPFLLCGLVVWKWFATTITSTSQSLAANKMLMSQVYVPKLIFPIISVLHQFCRFLIVFAILILFLNLYGLHINPHYLELLPLLAIQIVFLAAIGFLLASAIPFLPDLAMLIPSAIQLLFFMSGIFFSIESLPESYQAIFNLNPMFVLIDSYRNILIYSQSPNWGYLLIILLISILLLGIAIFFLKKFDIIYPKLLN